MSLRRKVAMHVEVKRCVCLCQLLCLFYVFVNMDMCLCCTVLYKCLCVHMSVCVHACVRACMRVCVFIWYMRLCACFTLCLQQGVTQTSELVNVVDFYQSHILPDLQDTDGTTNSWPLNIFITTLVAVLYDVYLWQSCFPVLNIYKNFIPATGYWFSPWSACKFLFSA